MMNKSDEKKTEINQIEVSDESDNKTYEIGYLLSPLIPSEDLAGATDQYLKQPITAGPAEVIGDWPAQSLSLTYPIRKLLDNKRVTFREAYFGALRFRSQPEVAVKLATVFRQTPELIRFLLIEISKAAMAEEKRLQIRQKRVDQPPVSEGSAGVVEEVAVKASVKPVMSADEIDKEIDQLLTTKTYVPK